MTITVPQQRVGVLAECDVLVCGGGVSGITAAGMALPAACDLAQVDIRALQAALKKDGVYLQDVPQGKG